jgi:hypothetical protein
MQQIYCRNADIPQIAFNDGTALLADFVSRAPAGLTQLPF